MSSRKQHAYEVALRMAQVKELRAQVALAGAVDKETAAKEQVNTVEKARSAVLQASSACVADGQSMDLARYELLTRLDSALAHRLHLADQALDQAAQERAEKASENVMAKRHRETVSEHLDDVRLAWVHAQAAKAQEDGIELWLESREEGL
jgi:hypothetical protein